MSHHSTPRTPAKKVGKKLSDFPLFKHKKGYWAKKVRRKHVYFEKIADDPDGSQSLDQWLDAEPYLRTGRTPPRTTQGYTVAEVCYRFMTQKDHDVEAGAIKKVTRQDYFRTCKLMLTFFGDDQSICDLTPEDFQSLANHLSKKYSVYRFDNTLKRIRSVLKYAYDMGLVDTPIRTGPALKLPPARQKRAHRQANPRKFEACEIRLLLEHAEQPLKAMIFLGINCGFGNSDCGNLPIQAIDFADGWIDFPRPKTAVPRKCPIWKETIAVLRQALACRPKAKTENHDHLVFVTKFGGSWAKETEDNPVSKEFRKLTKRVKKIITANPAKCDIERYQNIGRKGVSFYALRHTFETVAGGSKDQVAVDHIMGHVDTSMAAHYRESIEDERLIAVSDHVRNWLFKRKHPK